MSPSGGRPSPQRCSGSSFLIGSAKASWAAGSTGLWVTAPVAGRAYQSLGYAYANGSNQNMGLWNTFTVKTLKQTATNYYTIGTCP